MEKPSDEIFPLFVASSGRVIREGFFWPDFNHESIDPPSCKVYGR